MVIDNILNVREEEGVLPTFRFNEFSFLYSQFSSQGSSIPPLGCIQGSFNTNVTSIMLKENVNKLPIAHVNNNGGVFTMMNVKSISITIGQTDMKPVNTK